MRDGDSESSNCCFEHGSVPIDAQVGPESADLRSETI